MSAPLTVQLRLGFSMGWRIWSPNEVRFYTKTLAHSYFIYNILKSKLLASKIWVVNYSIFLTISKYIVFIEYLRFGMKHKEEGLRWYKNLFLSLAGSKKYIKPRNSNPLPLLSRVTSVRRFLKKKLRRNGIRYGRNLTKSNVRKVTNSRDRLNNIKTVARNRLSASRHLLSSQTPRESNNRTLKRITVSNNIKTIPLTTRISLWNPRIRSRIKISQSVSAVHRLSNQEWAPNSSLFFFYGGLYSPSFRKLLRAKQAKTVLYVKSLVWFWEKISLILLFFIIKSTKKEPIGRIS